MNKRKNAAALGAALAAAMMLTAAPAQAIAKGYTGYNLTPQMVLQQIQIDISNGKRDQAFAMLQRLRAMGVTSIVLDGQTILIGTLEQMITSGSPEIRYILEQYATTGLPANLSFQYETQTVASTSSSRDQDVFPVSSAG